MLQSTGSQRVRHDLATEQQQKGRRRQTSQVRGKSKRSWYHRSQGKIVLKNYVNNFDKLDQMRTENLPLYLAM